MGIGIHVHGGTGAGQKRPLKVKTWRCCGKTLVGYSCCSCGARRTMKEHHAAPGSADDRDA